MVNEVAAVSDVCSGDRLSEAELAAWAGFLRTHTTLIRRLDDELTRSHGLPLSSYDVLVQVESAPDRRLRMSELADAVLLSRSGLTRLVARLVDQGLLERVDCEKDARGAYAALTEAGRRRLEEARETHLAGVRRAFLDRLSEGDMAALARAWTKIAEGNPA